MSDLISRQAAIDALGEKPLAWTEGEYELGLQQQWEADVNAIKALPPAQPERKNGKWIEQDDSWDGVYYECSVCKEPFTLIDGTPADNLYNYCPNCGAKMEKYND